MKKRTQIVGSLFVIVLTLLAVSAAYAAGQNLWQQNASGKSSGAPTGIVMGTARSGSQGIVMDTARGGSRGIVMDTARSLQERPLKEPKILSDQGGRLLLGTPDGHALVLPDGVYAAKNGVRVHLRNGRITLVDRLVPRR